MLHIINACFVGKFGLADYTLSLARALSRHAHSEIVTAQDFDYPDVKFDGVITRIFRRTRNYPIDLVKFIRYVLKRRPDALVLQSRLKVALLDALVVRLLRFFGISVGTTVHDVLPHYPKAWSKIEFSFFYKSFDFLIVHSKNAEAKVKELGVTAPVLCIPHGVYDIYRLSELSRSVAREKISGLNDNDFVGLFFGLIDERKGISELIDAMASKKLPERFKLLVAGGMGIRKNDQVLKKKFEEMVSGEKCVAAIRRIPFSEVELYFSAADFVVVPYREGTTSGVVKLAIAFEKPIVATDVGDLVETVTPDIGLLVSSKNIAEDLPKAISTIERDFDQYGKAFLNIRSLYSWDKIGPAYFEFISDCVSRRRRKS